MQYQEWFSNSEFEIVELRHPEVMEMNPNHVPEGSVVQFQDGDYGYVVTGASGRSLVCYPVDHD